MNNLPARPKDLPEFENPPLREVAFSIQFEVPENYHELFVHEIWTELFPESPPPDAGERVLPTFETFGASFSDTRRNEINFAALRGPHNNKYTFTSDDGESILHLQPDRITKIWKKQQERNYPRFEAIRDDFVQLLETLESLFDKFKIGSIVPNQCELVYANFLKSDNIAKDLNALGISTFEAIGSIEGYHSSFSKVLFDEGGEKWARLRGMMWSTHDPDGDQSIQLNLAVRGAPEDAAISDCLQFFQRARVEIVQTFAHICESGQVKLWKRL